MTLVKLTGRLLFESGVRLEGLGPNTDLRKARERYRRAAILGDRQAQFFLALSYAAGQGLRKDHRLAMAWFKRAARAGEELCALVVRKGSPTVEAEIAEFYRLLRDLRL